MKSTEDNAEPRAFAFCSWHKNFADDVRLIRVIEQGSAAAGGSLFACAPCRRIYGLVPYTDQP